MVDGNFKNIMNFVVNSKEKLVYKFNFVNFYEVIR